MYKMTINLQIITTIKNNNSFECLQGKNLELQDNLTIQLYKTSPFPLTHPIPSLTYQLPHQKLIVE